MAAKEKTSSRLSAWLAPILFLLAAVVAAQPAPALTRGALETRAWEKTSSSLESRPVESLQLLNLHQQNGGAGYDDALGSPLAAENAAAGATKGMGGRALSSAEQAEFDAFAARAKSAGLQENPYRTGSWGTFDANGKFQEVTRIDVAKPGAPGWEGDTHMHLQPDLKDHLPLTTKIPGEQ